MTALVYALLALMVGVPVGLVFFYARQLDDERERRHAAEGRLIEQARTEGDRISALYERILEHRDKTAVDLVRVATTGHAIIPEARIADAEPTAHERLSRLVSEQTVQTGMSAMREEYRRAGAQLPDDDALREEVELILSGAMPTDGILRSAPLRALAAE